MAKIRVNIKTNKATVEQGQDTLIGKLLAQKGEIKINTPSKLRRKIKIVS